MPSIRISRRQALIGSTAFAASLAMPALSRAQSRPLVTHGVQSGDVAHDGAVIWARADREARMLVEWSTRDSFAGAMQVQALDVGTPTDFTGKLLLEGLPSDQDIFYRVTMQDASDLNGLSEP
ncbi:MAG: PhoD-like phosphatase N-terminal domain-containing protein, partial [Rhodobacteraceae bacterium]|nr:PhoD-like phosphatase N-terminal domain-containing protein [Paracoccaceae bacterium]